MRKVGRLTALKVAREHRPGRYPDGAGLYLQVAPGGSKAWTYRYKVAGQDRWIGLGSVKAVSLAKAREKAANARRLRIDGVDPIEHKRASKVAARLAETRGLSFDEAAANFITSHRAGW
jgi:hypothetical protein